MLRDCQIARVKANSIIYSFTGFPLTPKQMVLNDREWSSYICDDDHFADE